MYLLNRTNGYDGGPAAAAPLHKLARQYQQCSVLGCSECGEARVDFVLLHLGGLLDDAEDVLEHEDVVLVEEVVVVFCAGVAVV